MQPPKHRHYLAQFYGANDNPKIRYRKTNLIARAIYPRGGVKSFVSLQIRIVALYERGAIIQAKALEFLPEHFYICLGDGEIYFTCARRNIVRGEMIVSFAEVEDTFFIETLAKIHLPLATFGKLRDSCPPVIQARMRSRQRDRSR